MFLPQPLLSRDCGRIGRISVQHAEGLPLGLHVQCDGRPVLLLQPGGRRHELHRGDIGQRDHLPGHPAAGRQVLAADVPGRDRPRPDGLFRPVREPVPGVLPEQRDAHLLQEPQLHHPGLHNRDRGEPARSPTTSPRPYWAARASRSATGPSTAPSAPRARSASAYRTSPSNSVYSTPPSNPTSTRCRP